MSVLELFDGRTRDEDLVLRLRSTRHVQVHIVNGCALKCEYCVSNMPNVDGMTPTVIDRMGIDAYLERLDVLIGDNTILSIGGTGEPMQSPYFAQVLAFGLARASRVVVPTNLEYAAKIRGAEGPLHIQSSFHLGAYLDMTDGQSRANRWIDTLLPIAAEVAASLSIITPMTPAALDAYQPYADRIKAIAPQAVLVPVELYHTYNGKTWPSAYSDEQQAKLGEIQRRNGYNPAAHGIGSKAVRARLSDRALKHVTNDLRLKGAPCHIRAYALQVLVNGDIIPCQSSPQIVLGNIESSGHLFSSEPFICPADVCCCKAAGNLASLSVYGITLHEYYAAHYDSVGEPEKAELFK